MIYAHPDIVPLPTSLRGADTPIGPLLWTVFTSILEVFIQCFAGWVLARRGIIDKKTQKQMNRINVSLFTPCLLFSKVAFSLSPQKLKELWIIPIFFAIVTTVSATVAWILASMLRLKRSQRNFAIAASMFNNSNSLPIALMQSLVITVHGLKWDKGDTKDSMVGRALTYLVLYSTFGMMLRWSYGVHLLSQADEEVVPDIVEPGQDRETRRASVAFIIPDESTLLMSDQDGASDTASSSTSLERHPSMAIPPHTVTQPPPNINGNKRAHAGFFYSFPNTPTRSRVDLQKSSSNLSSLIPPPVINTNTNHVVLNDDEWGGGAPLAAPPSTGAESIFRRLKRRLKKFWRGVKDFMTVPMWAALASLVVACVRPVQHALENHMQPVKGSLVALGNCSIPVTLVVLGAYFYTPPPEGDSGPEALPTTVNGHADGTTEGHLGRERESSWSQMSLRESIKEVFKLRGLGRSGSKHKDSNGYGANKGEGKTVFVSIVARMFVTPALILPAMVALAVFDLHKVMEDPVFVVSMVLLVSSPPALTLAQITQAASGDAFERLISKTIFWSYCIFTPPLTIVYVVLAMLLAKL